MLSDIEAFADFMRNAGTPHSGSRHRFHHPRPGTVFCSRLRAMPYAVLYDRQCIASGASLSPSEAMSGRPVNLFSDLIVHHMGQGLADGITQGAAGPDEFRTAPLWGLGQRVYFLHDGRTNQLARGNSGARQFGK